MLWKPNIAKLEEKKNAKGLIKALLYQQDVHVKYSAAHALGRIGDERALGPLITALENSGSYVQKAAVEALVNVGEPAVELLIAAIKGGGQSLRNTVAAALGEIRDPWALEPLISALDDEDSWCRRFAAKALGKIGGARALQPLINILEDEDWFVRNDGINALVNIGEPAVEPLIATMKYRGKNLRQSTARALGEINDPRAVEPLVAMLKDKEESVRRAAARALGEIGDIRAVEPLISAIKNSGEKLRTIAAESLGNIGDKQAINPLKELLNDEINSVRIAAMKALSKMHEISSFDMYNQGVSLYHKGQHEEAEQAFDCCFQSEEYRMQAAYARGLCQKKLGRNVQIPGELGNIAEDAGPIYVASNLTCYLVNEGHQATLIKEGGTSEIKAIIDGSHYLIRISSLFGSFNNWAWRINEGKRISIPDTSTNPNPTKTDKFVISLITKASSLPMSQLPSAPLINEAENQPQQHVMSSTPSASLTNEYTSTDYNFCLNYPSGWEVVFEDIAEGEWVKPIGLSGPKGLEGCPGFMVLLSQVSTEVDMHSYMNNAKADLNHIWGGIDLVCAEERQVKGFPAAWIQYTYQASGGSMEELNITLKLGWTCFVLMQFICECPAARFAEFLPTFVAMIESVCFTNDRLRLPHIMSVGVKSCVQCGHQFDRTEEMYTFIDFKVGHFTVYCSKCKDT